MRSALRFGIAIWAAGLLLAPGSATAQDSPATSTANAPAATVGPRELQDFSLSGTVTRPADQPPARTAEPSRARIRTAQSSSAPPPSAPAPRATPPQRRASQIPAAAPAAAEAAPETTAPAALPTMPAPVVQRAPVNATTATVIPSPDAALSSERHLLIWPWILAALVLGAAAAFLFWRNRTHRHAFAGGPQLDLFAAPEPAPTPAPAPRPAFAPPPKAAPPAPAAGIVSTALRPWIEIGVQPLRCIVTDATATIEFELDLFNSGSAPARDVHVSAVVVNAGPDQDRDLTAFFARPAGPGERIAAIPPLKHVTVTTQLSVARSEIQPLEIGGRQVFVPLIAFNAIYLRGAGAGDGQTSVAYLVGRDNQGEKLAPFRLDLGARQFRGLGARLLPNGVRR